MDEDEHHIPEIIKGDVTPEGRFSTSMQLCQMCEINCMSMQSQRNTLL